MSRCTLTRPGTGTVSPVQSAKSAEPGDIRGADSQHAAQATSHVGLVAEACNERDVAHGAVPSQEELPCPLDTTFHDVAMDWNAYCVAEKRFEVGHAESRDVGQLLEGEITIEVCLDVIAYSAKAPFRQLTSRGVRGSCWVVARSLQQSSCNGCGEAVQKDSPVGIACRALRSEAPPYVLQVRVPYPQGRGDSGVRGL